MMPTPAPDAHVLLPDRQIEGALTGLYRSVSAAQFYPPYHPQLREAVSQGYRAWRSAEADCRWTEPGLEYRAGGLWLGELRVGERNPAIASLARTFASHGIHRVRVRRPLSRDAFAYWAGLLASNPDALTDRGGIAGAWEQGVYSPFLEIRAARAVAGRESLRAGRPRDRGWGEGLPSGIEARVLSDPMVQARIAMLQSRSPRERRVLDLLLRLSREPDMARFLDILRRIARHAGEYLEEDRFREAYAVVLYLFREAQNMDALGDADRRDYLLDTVRLLVRGEFLSWLIERVASDAESQDAEAGAYVLRVVGERAVVPLINALVAEKRRLGRRRLVDVLVSIGPPVVPYAVRMLEDQRWFVVRNMVTVLGGIGTQEAIRAVLRISRDPDPRIRKEAARVLGRAAGPEVEDRIVELMEDPDPSVRLMAISAAGSLRTPVMMEALWDLYRAIPIRSSEWALKPAVLQAVGRSGLREAVPRVVEELRRKHWFHRRRWTEVRRAAIQALGDLGGPEAVAALEAVVEDDPSAELRAAARRALAAARGTMDR